MRSLASSLLAVLCCTPAALAAATGDPTFNGTIVRAACYVRTLTVCVAGYCQQTLGPCEGDHCGTLNVFVNRRQYSLDSGQERPLDALDISPAEIGKPLWLKFKIEVGGKIGNTMVLLKPDPMGGYQTTAVTFVPIETKNGVQAFAVENFECERFPGTGQ